MLTWTSSVLLSTLVVIGSSFPHPDEYRIPEIGRNGRSGSQRSQYYVLHSDGTFKYGYDTADGAFESTMLNSDRSQNGQFGYVDPDGNHIHLEYEAGENGFVARGDHLPKPSAELARAIADVVARSKPFVDPLAGDGFGDRSYGFKFSSDDHSRNEQSDADGTVTGSYSYVDEFGHLRSFTYKAGKDIGFVIEGDSLTVPNPAVPASNAIVPRVRQSSAAKPARIPKPVSRNPRPVPSYRTATRPAKPVTRTSHSDAVISSSRSETPGDASYSFSYSADDHSRRETSDSDLNVEGSFSFIGDDGDRRSVSYIAGRETGFQAVGDHFPVAPEGDFGARVDTSSSQKSKFSDRTAGHAQAIRKNVARRPTPTLKTTPVVKPARTYYAPPASTISQTHRKPSFVSPIRRFKEADIRSTTSDDGSYSVFYDAGSHSRFEQGDSNNNVEGEFTFTAENDGETRKLTYEASRDTGFIAEGDHLPVGPAVPGASSGIPTGRLEKVTSVGYVDPLAGSDGDASYSFGFDSDTYSRSESSDADGNVKGSYTVVDDDGTIIKYEFRAGKGIGFETTEVSRSQGPIPVKPLPYKAPTSSGADHPRATFTQPATTGHAASSAVRSSQQSFVSPIRTFEEANIRSSSLDDGSYSFSYGTDSHSRSETGDSNNNVDGEFSFVSDDDGVLRKIIYEAGSDTGFIAEGDHIPVGPAVPGASSGQPTGRFDRVSSTPFVDPLARSESGSRSDASYAFSFDSDGYSRVESADEDGNVQGSYTVVDSDGTAITHKFRAGNGIGFETEEVSRIQGSGVGKPLSEAKPSTDTSSAFGTSGFSSGTSKTSRFSSGSSRTSGTSSGSSKTSGYSYGSPKPSSTFGLPSAASKTTRTSGARNTAGTTFKSSSRTSSSHQKSPSRTLSTDDFELRQYDAADGDKFGYVIRYD